MTQISAVGIDLGTTYSSLAIVDNQGVPEIVPNAETERLTPSAVFFDDDAIVVGQIARDALLTCPNDVVLFIKRQIGKASWHFSHAKHRFSAVDVSSFILQKLKQDAEAYLGRPLPYAVITVPAYFDDERRRATITAGEIAGFQVLDLVNEPTAAAIAFGIDRSKKPETVMVYDLGGGTFDVTIMRVDGKDIRIIGTDGDPQLGGKDFDDAIMRFMVDRFSKEHGFDPTSDPYVAGDLRSQAEKAKRELSKRIKSLVVLRAQGKTSRLEISREEFNNLIKVKLDITKTLVRTVLHEAKMEPEDIDRILLIGGSTRVVAVKDLLADFFGKDPDNSVNPDEAVALGAALMAAYRFNEIKPEETPAQVAEKVGGLQITDVVSHSFGIEAYVPGTNQRINTILIPRNKPIPYEQSKEFVTNQPGQTAIKVTIYQGEFSNPDLCNPVGEFTLSGLPPGRPVGCKVRVTVSCDTNGIVNVSALDIETGKQTHTSVSYKSDSGGQQKGKARERWKEKVV